MKKLSFFLPKLLFFICLSTRMVAQQMNPDNHGLPDSNEERKEKYNYYCKMHPEIISDAPGICPKCLMNLEIKKVETVKNSSTKVNYFCPEHESSNSPKKGRCPICGGKLKKKKIFNYD